ncbi:hypothetical protein K2X05_11470 [bacterium]|nr:hypothetical protein [bacterium]
MQQIIVVTGKGGVGKSFIASLLAQKMSLKGQKTLLVDMVADSYLAASLGVFPPQGVQSQTTRFGFDWALWLGEACLAEYVQYWVRIPWMSRTFLKNAWLKSLIHLAPGLREIAFLGKLTSQIRGHGPAMNYDCIVVDAVSTGHFLSLIKTPQALSETVSSGPMFEQSRQIQKVLNDPQIMSTFVVTNLETYSLNESRELSQQLAAVLKSPTNLVANKIFPVPSDLEPIDKNMNPAQKEFLMAQESIKSYQEKTLLQLRQRGEKFFSVPFYFSNLTQVLESSDEARNLF